MRSVFSLTARFLSIQTSIQYNSWSLLGGMSISRGAEQSWTSSLRGFHQILIVTLVRGQYSKVLAELERRRSLLRPYIGSTTKIQLVQSFGFQLKHLQFLKTAIVISLGRCEYPDLMIFRKTPSPWSRKLSARKPVPVHGLRISCL